jgi:hypothetical protein
MTVLTKRVHLAQDGTIANDSTDCRMSRGIMHRMVLPDWRDYAAISEETPGNVAYALGAIRGDLPAIVRLVAKADPQSGQAGFAARTAGTIQYSDQPGLVLLDIDIKAMPENVRVALLGLGGFCAALETVCPGAWRPLAIFAANRPAPAYFIVRRARRILPAASTFMFLSSRSRPDGAEPLSPPNIKQIHDLGVISPIVLARKPAPGRLRVNSTHADRGLDAYWTPPEATTALLKIESVPRSVADPACGSGAILDVLRAAGHIVHGWDIAYYGWPHSVVRDYLAGPVEMNGVAIVTNPPYRLRAEVHREGPRRRHAVRRFPSSTELPGIHAPEGIFRDAPALKGLGVLTLTADDAPARMDRFQGAFKSLLRVVCLGRVQGEGPP